MNPWRATVLTLFPEMFPGPLGASLAGKALDTGRWTLDVVNIRDFAADRHQSVDDAPFGGGPGMVLRADVVDAALDAAMDGLRPAIYLSPRGRVLDQALVREFAEGPGVILLCGRYEGVDMRVVEARNMIEVSLGDFVLSGGEPAAIALIDAALRLVPGVVGEAASLEEESFAAGLLEYPQYTRPAEWRGRRVPEILLGGHHRRIEEWRRRAAERVTRERRPDLWSRYVAAIKGARIPT